MDLAIHDFDWLLWTFGPPVSVEARSERPGGAKAVVQASWMHSGPFTADAQVTADWGIGEAGRPRGRVGATPADGVALPAFAPGVSPFERELSAALEAWRARRPTLPVEAADGVRAVRLAALCRESAARGRALPWETPLP